MTAPLLVVVGAGEEVAGFVDDRVAAGSRVLDLPVLGTLAWLVREPRRVALGIGDNATRARVAARCLEAGSELVRAIHPRAVVAPSARIAEGAVVMAAAVVNPSAEIGRGAIVNTAAVIEHDCVVGPFAHVSPNATLGGGAGVGEEAHLGIGATMLPGVKVGARSVIGGGALVARDVPGDVVARGVPARVARPR